VVKAPIGIVVMVMLLLNLIPRGAALAAEITCKKSPALTGQCRMVKGSLGLTQGLGVTLMAPGSSSRRRRTATPTSHRP
jgi:hypothetical protein